MYFSASSSWPHSVGSHGSRVILPNGRSYDALIRQTESERAEGMQFRNRFPLRTVMVFLHRQPGHHRYHTVNVKFPLDIMWCDAAGRIRELLTVPPGEPSCGGNVESSIVIEAPAFFASQNSLKIGDTMQLR